jgi:hypothetical protein
VGNRAGSTPALGTKLKKAFDKFLSKAFLVFFNRLCVGNIALLMVGS